MSSESLIDKYIRGEITSDEYFIQSYREQWLQDETNYKKFVRDLYIFAAAMLVVFCFMIPLFL